MSNNPSHRPTVRLELANREAACAALISLSAAFRHLMEFSVFPERLHVDDKRARLECLVQELIRKAKNVPTEFISETDEAAGVVAAIAMINESARIVAGQIG